MSRLDGSHASSFLCKFQTCHSSKFGKSEALFFWASKRRCCFLLADWSAVPQRQAVFDNRAVSTLEGGPVDSVTAVRSVCLYSISKSVKDQHIPVLSGL